MTDTFFQIFFSNYIFQVAYKTDSFCPILVSVFVIKIMTKDQCGEGKADFILQLIIHHGGKSRRELEIGTWSQELKQRLWKNGCLLICSMACSVCFLI